MPSYSYNGVTMALRQHIEQVSSVVSEYIKDGKLKEAWNLAHSFWGTFRLWERITSGDKPHGDALKFEQEIEQLLLEAK